MEEPAAFRELQDELGSPRPFSPGSPRSGQSGCGRLGLIGCGIVLVLLGLSAVIFLLKARDLFGWALGKFESQVMQNLPADLAEAERQRLAAAFSAAADAVRQGEVDPRSLQRLQEQLRETLLKVETTLDREDVLELTQALEEVAGASPSPQPEAAIRPQAVAWSDVAIFARLGCCWRIPGTRAASTASSH